MTLESRVPNVFNFFSFVSSNKTGECSQALRKDSMDVYA